MGQLLRYNLSVAGKPEEMSDREYMSTWFVDGVRSCLKSGGFARTNNGQEQGGVFLVGFRGSIYRIDSDFQVGIPVDPYDAVGCGEDFALGALHAMPAQLAVKTRITKALDAASAYSGAVAPPYVILGEPV